MDSVHKIIQKIEIPRSVDAFMKSDLQNKVIVTGIAGVSVFTLLKLSNALFGTDPLGRTAELFGKFAVQEKKRNINVDNVIEQYNAFHDEGKTDVGGRNSSYSTLVNAYYELATLFYEWGWGQSFHFANQLKGESFLQSILRHEYYIAGRLGVSAGDRVLDCGCGVGGPMRNIAKFTSALITGVTLSEYQVIRGNELNNAAGLQGKATSVQSDFMKMEKFPNNYFDGVYAIEATCHAPQREVVYGEIFRVLKPGQIFACYEWCLTPKYDASNEYHQLIKKKIEEGNGLPDMCSEEACVEALKSVGFELIEARDMALDERFGGDPWWMPLYPSYNPLSFRFQMSSLGMWLTRNMVWVLEGIWLAPKGTYKVQSMLQQGAWGCVNGGTSGTFTPMYLMVARKPLK